MGVIHIGFHVEDSDRKIEYKIAYAIIIYVK